MPPVVLLAPLIWAMHVGFCFAIGREKTHRSAGRGSHVCIVYPVYYRDEKDRESRNIHAVFGPRASGRQQNTGF